MVILFLSKTRVMGPNVYLRLKSSPRDPNGSTHNPSSFTESLPHPFPFRPLRHFWLKKFSHMSTPERKVDRYGYYDTGTEVSREEAALQERDASKELNRTGKWRRMIARDWSNLNGSTFSKVASRIKKGIPDGIRAHAWQKITEMEKWKKTTPEFSSLKDEEITESERTIDVDLPRTFPQMAFYSEPAIIEALRQVLYAYYNFDREVGYCQGMAFIAGMFTAYMDAESAFYCFVHVMQSESVGHRGYFLRGFPRLAVANQMLDILLAKKAPAVRKHLEKIGIAYAMFTPKWFCTAYQGLDWAPELQLRLFERFLFYGTRFLLAFALGFIKSHEAELSTGELEDVLPVLQKPHASPKMQKWHTVLETWEKYWITKKEYAELVAAASH
jgi:hypothetical protein